MKIRKIMPGLLVIANLAALAVPAKAQSLLDLEIPPALLPAPPRRNSASRIRVRREATKIRNYLFDAFGPYPHRRRCAHGGLWPSHEYRPGSGGTAQRAIAGDSGQTSALQPSAPRRVMRYQKPSKKILCITAVSAKACCRGCATL